MGEDVDDIQDFLGNVEEMDRRIPAANVVGEYVQENVFYRVEVRFNRAAVAAVEEPVGDGWTEDPYPEHARQAKVLDDARLQGELLEWMQENGYFVCVRLPDICARCGAVWPKDKCRNCTNCGFSNLFLDDRHHLVPVGKSINQILAEFHGIDLDRIEEEKRAMLKALRS